MQSPPLTPNSEEMSGPVETTPSLAPAARKTLLRKVLLILGGALVLIPCLAYLLNAPRDFDVVSASMEPTLMSHEAGVNLYSADNYHDTIQDHIQVSSTAYW